MRLINLVILFAIASCSNFNFRSIDSLSSKDNFKLLEENGYYVVESSIELENNPGAFIPLPNFIGISFSPENSFVKVLNPNDFKCSATVGVVLTEDIEYQFNQIDSRDSIYCLVKRAGLKRIELSYRFKKHQVMPLYQASWMNNAIQSLVSRDEITLSKIQMKVEGNRNLFLNEKQYLRKVFKDSVHKTIDVSKKEEFKFSMEEGDIAFIENISGTIFHSGFGSLDYQGSRNIDVSSKFRSREVKAGAFFCRSRKAQFKPLGSSVSFDNNKKKVGCLVNTKKKGIFTKNKFSGIIEFDFKLIEKKELQYELEKILIYPKLKLKEYIHQVNQENIKKIEEVLTTGFEDYQKSKSRVL